MKKEKSKIKNSISGTIATVVLFSIFCFFSLQVSASYAEAVSSSRLIEDANKLDGKTVTYTGELVAAVLNRGKYCWVNLNDGSSAVGVWCDTAMLKGIKFSGDYKHKGDVLEVTGLFHRACSHHSGELDIHADAVRLVERGFQIKEKMNGKRLNIAAAMFLIVLSMLIIFRKKI